MNLRTFQHFQQVINFRIFNYSNAAWEAQGKWGLEAMTNFILTNPDAKTPSVSSGTTTG